AATARLVDGALRPDLSRLSARRHASVVSAAQCACPGVPRSASGEKLEELADPSRAGERIGDRTVGLDRVVAAAGTAFARDEAGGGEVADDAVDGALGDPDRLAELAQPDPRVLRDAEQHQGVVGEKRPARRAVARHNARLGFLE